MKSDRFAFLRYVEEEEPSYAEILPGYTTPASAGCRKYAPLELANRKDARKAATEMLGRVGLSERLGHYPKVLSGGEQQRVALARAMVPRPTVMLMDEPFSGLDQRLRESVRQETLAILRETRASSMLVTHDPHLATAVGTRTLDFASAGKEPAAAMLAA